MRLEQIETFPELKDGKCREMQAFDDHIVRTALWPATTPTPRGTICLLQGRAEYIEKYYEVVSELRAKGFAVATFDWRGQGGSDRLLENPRKGHIGRFSDYGRDLEQFLHEQVLPDCPRPFFALAHSMGALILLNQLPRLRTIFDRAALSAPLVQLATDRRKILGKRVSQITIRRLTGLARLLMMGQKFALGVDKRSVTGSWSFDTNPLTSDGPRYDRNRLFLEAYPEKGIAGPTFQWVHEACKAMSNLQSSDFQSAVHTPTLMMPVGFDQIVSSKATAILAQTMRCGHAITIAGSHHEILMEKNIYREQFWAAFDAFIPGSKDD